MLNLGRTGAGGLEQRAAATLVAELDVHHAVVVFVGIRVDEDAIDDAEDGGGRADAEGERENGGKGEAGGFAKLAKGEA